MVNYFLRDYEALRGYLTDGRFEIDKNLGENDIWPVAVGHKSGCLNHQRDGTAAGWWRSSVLKPLSKGHRETRECLILRDACESPRPLK